LIIQQGGTWSGKTFGVLTALYLLAVSTEQPLLISVVGVTVPHLKRGALRQFIDIVNELGRVDAYNRTDQIFQIGESRIEFFSADDDGKVRGSKRDILFVNECNLLNYEKYRQLSMRTAQTTILDFNPVGEFWLHDKILPTADKSTYLFKRTTYHDNPSVPEKVQKEIELLKETDPQLYRVYAEGKTGMIQGRIFDNVQFVSTFPDDCKKVAYGLDFGFTNDPTCLVRAGVLHGQLYLQELIYETGLTNQDIATRLQELKLTYQDEIFADSAEPKSIEEIKRKGFTIKGATKGQDSIRHGIDLLKRYKMNITQGSVNFRREAMNYKWATDRDGNNLNKPVDKFNHCWDAARYYAVMKLGKQSGLPRFVR